MKKVLILIVGIMLFFSCNGAVQKDADKSVFGGDSIKQSISENDVAHFDAIGVDTVIGDFHISYVKKDNENIIRRQSVTGDGESVLLKYADSSVFLDIHEGGRTILSNKEINKFTFKSIIPKDEIEQYQLCFFEIEKVTNEGVLFVLNICIPDTDICYFFELNVSKNGDFIVTEIEPNEEED
ncbi:MAG: DUF4738 domain-containing protein [Dysgonomonas sp.]